MRVMVLTDAPFAQREHQLLTRLEIGLADDGAAILHAVPVQCSADIVNAFSSTLVRYGDAATPLWRTSRARQLLAAAREVLDTPDLRVDVVHVFGHDAWSFGEAVAREAGAALVLEVWRAELIGESVRRVRRYGRGGPRPGGALPGAALLTSSEEIGEELRNAMGPRHGGGEGSSARIVGVAPWGVPAAESSRPPIDPTRGFAMSVVAEGRGASGAAEIKALLEGVQRVSRRFENLLVFLDGVAADRGAVWRTARRLKLLDRVTAVAEMEGRREPILQTDILALPEPDGVCRTLPLAAMTDGVAVMARPDRYHKSWLNDRTARMVGTTGRTASPEEWERAIIACVEETSATSALRHAARSLVREERTLTAYVEGVRRVYDRVLNVQPELVATRE